MQFPAGGVSLGSAAVNGSGVATLTTAALPVGVNSVTADYAATGNYAPSSSSAVSITITQATPTLAAPSASPSGATFGTPVTLTQSVPTGVTGTITFFSGSTPIGTAAVVSGFATFTTSSLPAGSNSITASFPGNANYAATVSAAGTIAITQATPTLTGLTASPAPAV